MVTATEKLRLLLQYALAVAAEEDKFTDTSLTTTALMKYAYVGDLAYAERNGTTFSGTNWEFLHFGPFAGAISAEMEPACRALGGEAVRGDNWTAFKCPRGKTDDVARKLPPYVATAVRKAVRKYGSQLSPLLADVYRSPPMLRAVPGSVLDFRRVSDASAEAPAPEVMTARQRKKHAARVNEARERFRAKLQARKPKLVEVRPELTREELDALKLVVEEDRREAAARDDIGGRLQVADDVWHSPARTEDELP